jgi:hypothetical protein
MSRMMQSVTKLLRWIISRESLPPEAEVFYKCRYCTRKRMLSCTYCIFDHSQEVQLNEREAYRLNGIFHPFPEFLE